MTEEDPGCDDMSGLDSSAPAVQYHFPTPESCVLVRYGSSQQGWGPGPDKLWGAVEGPKCSRKKRRLHRA